MTHDTGHITCYTQGVMNIFSKFRVPSSNGLVVKMFLRFDTNVSVTCSVMNVFFRKAPATFVVFINIKCEKEKNIILFLMNKMERIRKMKKA